MSDKPIRAIFLRTDGKCFLIDIKNDTRKFQAAVGGYIKSLYLDISDEIALIIDDDGLFKEKPMNEPASIFAKGIAGNVLVVGRCGDAFCSVPSSAVEFVSTRFPLIQLEGQLDYKRYLEDNHYV